MIEFLADNAIWIIVVAIVLVMALIGYLSENSDLGKKVLNSKKKTKPTKVKKEKKEKPALEPTPQIDPANTGLMSAVSEVNGEGNILGTTSNVPINDAWSTNVDTNAEVPSEVSEGTTDNWLNTPVNVANTEPEVLENTPNQDVLFDLPEATSNDSLPEVNVETLPNNDFSNVEILDVDDDDEYKENNFDDVEILKVDDSDITSEEPKISADENNDEVVTDWNTDQTTTEVYPNDDLNWTLEDQSNPISEEKNSLPVESEENDLPPEDLALDNWASDVTNDSNDMFDTEVEENNQNSETALSESNEENPVEDILSGMPEETEEKKDESSDNIWK